MREHYDACERDGELLRNLPAIPDVKATDLVSFSNNYRHMYLSGHYQITETRYITVKYESMVTWKLAMDRLRCSPAFHGRPRYDCVIANWGDAGELAICKLVRAFIYQANGRDYWLALVHPMNAQVEHQPGDKTIGLCRVREVERADCVIIPIRSIIRGAVLVADRKRKGEYTVMDTVDGDMYFRLMSLFPDRDMEMDI